MVPSPTFQYCCSSLTVARVQGEDGSHADLVGVQQQLGNAEQQLEVVQQQLATAEAEVRRQGQQLRTNTADRNRLQVTTSPGA